MATRIDKLFVEVNAETTGFERGMKGVDRELSKFADFVKGKPLVAVAALGSAFLLVANQAQQMAREVDAGVRRAIQAMPALAASTGELRQAIQQLSLETGRSQVELSKVFALAANTGVESFAQLNQVVRAAAIAADASGEDFQAVFEGIDRTLGAFGISAARANSVAAKLFAVSQGRLGFTELTDALQPVIPLIHELGLSADVALGALAALMDGKELSPKQVVAQLKELAAGGAEGAAEIQRLAGEAIDTEAALTAMTEAAEVFRSSADNASAQIQQRLSAVMIRLGNQILPTVTGALEKVADLLDRISGTRAESLFANLADKLPGTEAGLRAFITQQSTTVAALNDAIRIRQAEIDGIANKEFGAGVARARALSEEIAGFKDDIREVTTAANLGGEALADMLNPRTPRSGGGSTEAELKRIASEQKRQTAEVEASLKRVQDFVDGLTREVFPRVVTAMEEYQRVLAEEVPLLEKGNAEQRERARVIKETGELMARTKDLVNAADLDDFAPTIQLTQFTDIQIKGIDFQRQALDIARIGNEVNNQGAEIVANSDAEHLAALMRQGQELDAAVMAAYDIAEAFGLADANLGNMLASLSGIAGGIGPFVEALRQGGSGNILATALPLAGSVAGLIEGIRGAFADSPELQAAREALEMVAHELRENTQGLREFSQSGSTLGSIETAIASFIEKGLPGLFDGRSRVDPNAVTRELAKFGLTLDDIRQFAADAGLPFVELSRDTLPQFLAFLELVGVKLDQITEQGFFGTGPQGRLDRVRTDAVFSPEVESAGQMFQRMIEAAFGGGDGPAVLAGAFLDFDWAALTSSDPGIQASAFAAARAIIANLYETVTAEGFDTTLLGDFSPQAFVDFLTSTLGMIPEGLNATGEEVRTAAQRWSDAMQTIARTASVFDLSAAEQAELMIAEIGELIPYLGEQLSAFDLSTVDGIQDAIAAMQNFIDILITGEGPIHGLGFDLEALGLTTDDFIGVLDLLKGAFGDAAREAENLARETERQAVEARRNAERDAAEQARQREEQRREAERAHQEALRRAEERRRAELALGSETLRVQQEFFDLFDIDELAEQLDQRLALLAKESPVFAGLFSGANARSAGSRTEVLERLRGFALQNPFGVESGNLTAEVVRAQLLDIAEVLKALNEVEVTGQGELGSFAIDRSITELRGERLEGLLSTGNIWLEEIAASNAAIRDLLATPRSSVFLPPALPTGSPGNAGTTSITIVVDGATVQSTPALASATSAFLAAIVDSTALAEMGVPQ